MDKHSLKRPHNFAGFSLLEVLIAMVLVSFAFLATASLHINSLRDTQLSTQMVQAAELVHEMNQRMQVMSPAFAPNVIGVASGTLDADCLSGGCTPAEMVLDELKRWQDSVAARLPEGGAIVCRDSAAGAATPANPNCTGGAGDPILVKVWWRAKGDGTANYHQFSLPFAGER